VKQMLTRLILAAVLVGAADVARRAAIAEERLADAQEELTIQPDAVTSATFDEVENELAFAGRIPLVGASLLDDVREQRAVAAYWNGDYASVAAIAPVGDDVESGEPDLMFLAANAAYRSTIQSRMERAALLRALDESLQRFGDVLEAAPSHTGAAYNYEFVARLRTALARGRQGELLANETRPNMHGEEGDPPQGTKPPEFNVIVPLRPDERQEQFDAGVGGVTRRRG
jgi:hypothetical protein